MPADIIASLIDLGSAGAVIIVVIVFLNYIGKRDQEWRDFFTLLNKANTDDMTRFAGMMERLAASVDYLGKDLKAHDQHVEERIQTVVRKARAKPA